MYYLLPPDQKGDPVGPYSVKQLKDMFKRNEIRNYFVAKDGDKTWTCIELIMNKKSSAKKMWTVILSALVLLLICTAACVFNINTKGFTFGAIGLNPDSHVRRWRATDITHRQRPMSIRAGMDEDKYNEMVRLNSEILSTSFGIADGSELGQLFTEDAVHLSICRGFDAAMWGRNLGCVTYGTIQRPGTYEAQTLGEIMRNAQTFQFKLMRFGSAGKDQQIAGLLIKSGKVKNKITLTGLIDVYGNGTEAIGAARDIINLHSNTASFNELKGGISPEDQATICATVYATNQNRIRKWGFAATRKYILNMESASAITKEDAAAMMSTQDSFEALRGKFATSYLMKLSMMEDDDAKAELKDSVKLSAEDMANMVSFRSKYRDMSKAQRTAWCVYNRSNEENYGLSEADRFDIERLN